MPGSSNFEKEGRFGVSCAVGGSPVASQIRQDATRSATHIQLGVFRVADNAALLADE